jgi:hypothetical protein
MRWPRRRPGAASTPDHAWPAGTGATSTPDPASPAGVTWRETFAGWLAFGQTDFNQSMLPQHGEEVTAGLTVVIRDLARFLAAQADGGIRDAEAMPAAVTGGYLRCDALGGELVVRGGTFQAFVPAGRTEPRDALHLRMRYDLELDRPAGRRYVLHGFKLVENDPGYDSWSDTTTLFIRLLSDDEQLAVGVLQISPLAFMRELLSFRGRGPTRRARWAAVARYQRYFLMSVARTYAGPPVSGSRPSFPEDRPRPLSQAPSEPRFERLPGTRLGRAVVEFSVPDLDFALNLHRLRLLDLGGGLVAPTQGPVLLVPGSGVRAEMYYGQPVGPSCAEYLLGLGYDVWVETWRASIDLPPNDYTLDHAAMHDHPLAVQKVLSVCDAEAGSGPGPGRPVTLKAVVHCQGSISFMMAAVTGRIDARVTHIVSSAVSLFIDVTESTWLKQRLAMPIVARMFRGLDAQWGIRAPTPSAALFAALARRMERRCGNPSCQVANFMYGSGWDVLFRHIDDNGDRWVPEAVHEWSGREVGYTPLSLIAQVAESSRHGYIVPSPTPPPGAPPAYLAAAPRTDAQVTFIAGDHNNMFRWQGQHRAAHFINDAGRPGQADFVALPGFGHLDTFWSRDALTVSFPVIRAGLEWERGERPPHEVTGHPVVGQTLPPRRGRILNRR